MDRSAIARGSGRRVYVGPGLKEVRGSGRRVYVGPGLEVIRGAGRRVYTRSPPTPPCGRRKRRSRT